MTQEQLDITVVIPAHNRQHTMRRALRSVFDQTPRASRILVVDDASTDETAAVARDLGADVLQMPENGGPGEARNAGLRAARTTWVAFLDSDDEWLPGHLARIAPHLQQYALVSESAVMTPTPGDGPRMLGNAEERNVVFASAMDVMKPENRVATSATVVNRELAIEVGGFPASAQSEDLDLWLRLVERGGGIALGTVGYVYHRHSEQTSTNQQQMQDAAYAFLASYNDRTWFDASVLKGVQACQSWDALRAAIARRDGTLVVRSAASLAASPTSLPFVFDMLRYRRTSRERGQKEWDRLTEGVRGEIQLPNESASPA